jgi:hypothetical protein
VTFEPLGKVDVEELPSIVAVHSQKIEGLTLLNRFKPF